MAKKNLLSGGLWALFFIAFYAASGTLRASSALWPKWVCTAGFIFSIVQIALTIRDMKRERSAQNEHWLPLTSAQYKRAAAAAVIAIAWALCLAPIGFLVSSIAALLAIFVIYEPHRDKRHIITDAVVAVIFSSALYVLFKCLGVYFPDGLLI